MKKYSAYILMAMSCFAGAAHANSDVKFAGSVTSTTCDLSPDTGSGVAGLVQLGAVNASAAGTAKDITLRTNNSATPTCNAIPDAAIATITWSGNLDSRGVINQAGTATDAWVSFKTVNAEGTQADITSTKSSADFSGATLKTDGAKFTATLNGGTVAGTFVSATAFVVSYP